MTMTIQPSPLTLVLQSDPQLCYVLVEIGLDGKTPPGQAVNWAIVADASRSMRIPIINEAQFRQMVRTHGAEEVLVDGMAVWQFTGPIPEEMRAQSPGALDYVVRALHSVVEQMGMADRFSLVACAEEAIVLVPTMSGAERAELIRGIEMLKQLNLGEKTDLASGLQLGRSELRKGRSTTHHPGLIERLLLLTDGFTQNPDGCLAMARLAAAEGITITTIGLGGDFQEEVLTRLADLSHGTAMFLRNADEIPQAVAQELAAARSVVARSVALTIRPGQQVTLYRATRISPFLGPTEPVHSHPETWAIPLGNLERGTTIRVLLEMLVSALPSPSRFTLAENQPRTLAQLALTTNRRSPSTEPAAASDTINLVAVSTPHPLPLAPAVLNAAKRANTARLHEQAAAAASSGDNTRASRLLRTVATRLVELGETGLAETAHREAEALEQTGQISKFGAKELTYRTRRLGM
ncbi:MAG: VWA domain-containing protein [Chloroflexaceae bacterium]|nr:VWA domain-containing protein [Chloroflexaceae bacterium]